MVPGRQDKLKRTRQCAFYNGARQRRACAQQSACTQRRGGGDARPLSGRGSGCFHSERGRILYCSCCVCSAVVVGGETAISNQLRVCELKYSSVALSSNTGSSVIGVVQEHQSYLPNRGKSDMIGCLRTRYRMCSGGAVRLEHIRAKVTIACRPCT